jgi:hypothetical protein
MREEQWPDTPVELPAPALAAVAGGTSYYTPRTFYVPQVYYIPQVYYRPRDFRIAIASSMTGGTFDIGNRNSGSGNGVWNVVIIGH